MTSTGRTVSGKKCKTDKSLAIAHDLESLYVEPKSRMLAKARGRRKEADE